MHSLQVELFQSVLVHTCQVQKQRTILEQILASWISDKQWCNKTQPDALNKYIQQNVHVLSGSSLNKQDDVALKEETMEKQLVTLVKDAAKTNHNWILIVDEQALVLLKDSKIMQQVVAYCYDYKVCVLAFLHDFPSGMNKLIQLFDSIYVDALMALSECDYKTVYDYYFKNVYQNVVDYIGMNYSVLNMTKQNTCYLCLQPWQQRGNMIPNIGPQNVSHVAVYNMFHKRKFKKILVRITVSFFYTNRRPCGKTNCQRFGL